GMTSSIRQNSIFWLGSIPAAGLSGMTAAASSTDFACSLLRCILRPSSKQKTPCLWPVYQRSRSKSGTGLFLLGGGLFAGRGLVQGCIRVFPARRAGPLAGVDLPGVHGKSAGIPAVLCAHALFYLGDQGLIHFSFGHLGYPPVTSFSCRAGRCHWSGSRLSWPPGSG